MNYSDAQKNALAYYLNGTGSTPRQNTIASLERMELIETPAGRAGYTLTEKGGNVARVLTLGAVAKRILPSDMDAMHEEALRIDEWIDASLADAEAQESRCTTEMRHGGCIDTHRCELPDNHGGYHDYGAHDVSPVHTPAVKPAEGKREGLARSSEWKPAGRCRKGRRMYVNCHGVRKTARQIAGIVVIMLALKTI